MDGEDPDGELFDDEDLDQLPPATLRQLEQNALLSTQHQQRRASTSKAPTVRQDDDGAEYGLEDEDVVDLNAPPRTSTFAPPPKPVDEVTQREQWRAQRYGARPPPAIPPTRPPPPAQPSATMDVGELQARLAQLEQANAALSKANQEARQAVMAKAGETAIVRANQERVVKEYERKLATLQQKQADDSAKHSAEIEAARKDVERMETNKRFLEHDLQQESERARNARRTLKDGQTSFTKPVKSASPLSTPRKARNLPFRDGFDDDEMLAVSPSKSKERSKPGTPTLGVKRKRPDSTTKSPARPLSFSESDQHMPLDDAGASPGSHTPVPLPLPTQEPTESYEEEFDFSQFVLEHRTRRGDRALESFSKISFDSQPPSTLSSAIYDSLKPPWPDPNIEKYRVQVCEAIMDVWSRCLDDKLYAPLQDLMDLLSQIVIFSPPSLSGQVSSKAVALCVASADLVAVPRAKAFQGLKDDVHVPDAILANVRPYECLELLQTLALQCEQDGDAAVATFWTAMEHDFVVTLLARGQPLSHVKLMLDVLGTSIARSSFGALANPARSSTADAAALAARQARTESELLSRLTVMLLNAAPRPPALRDADDERLEPRDPADGAAYAPAAALALRSQALGTLRRLCFTRHGGRALASHRLVVGRLVRFLHEAVLGMYALAPATHAATAALVNGAVLVLAHLTAVHADVLDMRARLAVEPGGGYRHLVALSRVAFAEGATAVEEGVAAEAAECAHRMLDEMLSPEEGDAVVSVFSSGRPAAPP